MSTLLEKTNLKKTDFLQKEIFLRVIILQQEAHFFSTIFPTSAKTVPLRTSNLAPLVPKRRLYGAQTVPIRRPNGAHTVPCEKKVNDMINDLANKVARLILGMKNHTFLINHD